MPGEAASMLNEEEGVRPVKMDPQDLAGFGKASKEIVRAISKAVGAVYQPYATRRNADAKAYEIERLAEANAYKKILSKAHDADLERRAVERLKNSLVREQKNMEGIADQAIDIVEKRSGAIETAPKALDADWMSRFIEYAKNVSNSEIQRLWAEALARQVSDSGAVTLRLLDIMKNFNQKEILSFEKLSWVVQNWGAVYTVFVEFFENDISICPVFKTDDAEPLLDMGLISHGFLHKYVSFENAGQDVPVVINALRTKFHVRFDRSSPHLRRDANGAYAVLRGYRLTSVGKELHKVVQNYTKSECVSFNQISALEKYKNSFRGVLKNNGLIILEEDIVC